MRATRVYAALLAEGVIILVGIAMLAYGLAMTVSTPWGVSSWDVLHLGVVRHTGLTLGRVGQLTGLLVIAAAWCVRRKYVTGITVVNALLVGWFIDFFRRHDLVLYVDGLAGLLYLEAGVIVFAAGMATYLAPGRGAGPRDALMMSISDACGIKVGPVRVLLDLIAVGFGLVLGGPIGIGTVLAAVTLGPWVQLLLGPAKRLSTHITYKGEAGSTPNSSN